MSLAISSRYLDDNFKKSWNDGVQSENNSANATEPILIQKPFRCFALPNFVDFSKYAEENAVASCSSSCEPKYRKSYLEQLRDELELLDMHEKKNDLYNFRQSDDLHNVNSPAIDAFKRLFNCEMREWLQQVTGIPLNERVAMTASAYACSDYLLCHDDELEHRRIAFALYLSPNWNELDGGRLDVFSSDDELRPLDVVNSIVPSENMLTFFEVVPKSFHQVSEVTSKDKVRWSINGWFHGASIERPISAPEEVPTRFQPSFVEFDDLLAWINPDYLDAQTQTSIRHEFEEKSEIQLHHFIQAERYEMVLAELENSELKWNRRGPWNRRNYLSLDDVEQLADNRFPNLAFCLRLMRSEAMYILLSQFTNMRLHSLYDDDGTRHSDEYFPPAKKMATGENCEAGGSTSSTNNNIGDDVIEPSPCELELRKFEAGSYTLLSDSDFLLRASNEEEFVLDAQLYFTPCKWKPRHGAYTCYIDKDSSEEVRLLTVAPCANSLTLVCSESTTQRFVKYINHDAIKDFERPYLVDVSCTYFEVKHDQKPNDAGDGTS